MIIKNQYWPSFPQSHLAALVLAGLIAAAPIGLAQVGDSSPATESKLGAWPRGATLHAPLDAVGPGQRTVWIAAGHDWQVAVGDHWWLQVAAQPAARFDVLAVEDNLCFARVVPLVADLRLRPGQRVEHWPAPHDRQTGRARSAVVHVSGTGARAEIWIAAPPHVAAPGDVHVDYWRSGQYLGFGLVQRRDDRFWYATFTPATWNITPPLTAPAGAQPATTLPAGGMAPPTTAPAPTTTRATPTTVPTSRPARTTTAPAATSRAADTQPRSDGDALVPTAPPFDGRLRPGDEVIVRTATDISARRFVARVFRLTSDGALLNAGETAELTRGQRLDVYRAGESVGQAEVVRVQRSYAIARAVTDDGRADFAPRPGDCVRFSAPPAPSRVAGRLTQIGADGAIVAALTTTSVSLHQPLPLRCDGRTVGVVILSEVDGDIARGRIIPASLREQPTLGMRIELDD